MSIDILFDHFVLKRINKWRLLWYQNSSFSEYVSLMEASTVICRGTRLDLLMSRLLVSSIFWEATWQFTDLTLMSTVLYCRQLLWISMRLDRDRSYWISCCQLPLVWTNFFFLLPCHYPHSAVEYTILPLVTPGCNLGSTESLTSYSGGGCTLQ